MELVAPLAERVLERSGWARRRSRRATWQGCARAASAWPTDDPTPAKSSRCRIAMQVWWFADHRCLGVARTAKRAPSRQEVTTSTSAPHARAATPHRRASSVVARSRTPRGRSAPPWSSELSTAVKAHMQLEDRGRVSQDASPSPVPSRCRGGDRARAGPQGDGRHGRARRPEEPGFDGALEAVKAGIEHHVEEEEARSSRSSARSARHPRADRHAVHAASARARPSDRARGAGRRLHQGRAGRGSRFGRHRGASSMNKDELRPSLPRWCVSSQTVIRP